MTFFIVTDVKASKLTFFVLFAQPWRQTVATFGKGLARIFNLTLCGIQVEQ
jgi:hypothetical protein